MPIGCMHIETSPFQYKKSLQEGASDGQYHLDILARATFTEILHTYHIHG